MQKLYPEMTSLIPASSHKMLDKVKDYGIALLDTSGIITWSNECFCNLFGFYHEGVPGSSFEQCYTAADRSCGEPWHHLKTAAEEERCECEGVRLGPNQSTFFVNIIYYAQYAEGRRVEGYLMVSRDVSAKKRVIDELKIENERLIAELNVLNKARKKNREFESTLLSSITNHSLRTIGQLSDDLQALKVYAEIPQHADLSIAVESLVRSTNHLRQFMTDINEYERLARYQTTHADIDMHFLVKQVIAQFDLSGRKVEINLQPLAACTADPKAIEKVWLELIGNALKYTGKRRDSRITIGSVNDSNGSVFFVKDNGCGFRAIHSQLLFTPFSRLHPQDEFPGAGLGLARAYRLVKLYGGDIWAKSHLGRETTFYFTIPGVGK